VGAGVGEGTTGPGPLRQYKPAKGYSFVGLVQSQLVFAFLLAWYALPASQARTFATLAQRPTAGPPAAGS
jgi:hypothetical protein